MANEDNIDDKLSMSWFKAWLGLDNITNVDSKIKRDGNYEVHDQYITEVGIQFLSNAFQNYLDTNGDSLDVRDSESAQAMILNFLKLSGIKFVYDPEDTEETSKFDDLLSYARDLSSRTVLSVTIDKECCNSKLKISFNIFTITANLKNFSTNTTYTYRLFNNQSWSERIAYKQQSNLGP